VGADEGGCRGQSATEVGSPSLGRVSATLELREQAYGSSAAAALIAAVQQEYVARYGGPDESPVTPEEFRPPSGHFVVGYLDGVAVASGGLRRVDAQAGNLRAGYVQTVEIKRMFVIPEFRGRGFARVMLAHLEDLSRAIGAGRVVLETGMRQPEAMRLYESSGYERIEGFGHYCASELSVSYGKRL
jgi:GNAT superfamily N-acetyltransferase